MENKENIKLCKKCKERIDINAIKCPFCSAYQQIPTWGIIIIVLIGVYVVSQISSGFIQGINKNNNDNNSDFNSINKIPDNALDNNNSEFPNEKIYGFNETFIFDDLEITIGNNYSFDKVDNRYSDYNKQTVIKLPITVKNLSNETHSLNMFYYDVYGSNGVEVETLGSYFDDDINHAGNLRNGASYTKYMYIQYDGDGTYALEFDDYSTKINVEFEIVK